MIRLITFETSKEKWFEKACEVYIGKIKPFYPFERRAFKAPTGKQAKKERIKKESQILLEKSEGSFRILCDEKGKQFSSKEFSKCIREKIETGNKNIDFLIGGAFGVSEEVKEKSSLSINLSPFVMNHFVAQTVLMEQVYRAFTIWNGLPYHNE